MGLGWLSILRGEYVGVEVCLSCIGDNWSRDRDCRTRGRLIPLEALKDSREGEGRTPFGTGNLEGRGMRLDALGSAMARCLYLHAAVAVYHSIHRVLNANECYMEVFESAKEEKSKY